MLALIITVIILSLIYYLTISKFNYWKQKQVLYPKPIPLFGNFKDYLLLRKCIFEVADDIYQKYPNEPYVGVFYGTEPTLIVKDPDYIKLILTKDFYYFNSRENSGYHDKEVALRNLFFTSGDEWKIVRQNLTPVFSSSKMKKMFHLIGICNGEFEKTLDKIANSTDTDLRTLIAGYTIDCISSCMFGVNSEAMNNEVNIFRKMGEAIFDSSTLRAYKNITRTIWPAIFYNLGQRLVVVEVMDFFQSLIESVFKEREYKESNRHDLIDFMINLKQKKYIHGESISKMYEQPKTISHKVDDDLITAQCASFFGAGHETSSTILALTLFELAKNPEVQDKAIAEVDAYFNKNGNLFYESVHETPYLNACFNEAMRLYPVLGVVTREVMDDYTLPSGVSLHKGIRIHIPVYSIHRDPNYFPKPLCYQPERFLGEEKQNILPYTFMPFGDGPRICIGMRFAMMMMTSALMTLLRKYSVELAEGMPRELIYEPGGFTTQIGLKIRVKLIPRQ
ncbi:cytochrome P450 6B5-like isoform X1 [Leptidea sinapis]|uniref:cytochrome P450 6B5-like isoform X1 n=1 Tax=Leptidea sinapis TaxID=189913 RepID=UPI0021415BCD|nr:cytochrome P450 6B5-like isoform X1 [Leptidea sinapis]